jgi:two-component system, sensor histidine kinase PdtaS
MSKTGSTEATGFQYILPGAFARTSTRNEELTAKLHAALEREQILLRDRDELLNRQKLQAQEFDHRLLNSLQLIASLLSLQSRTAVPEAAAQLIVAARRVAAFGRVHHRLHFLDHQDQVEFKQYLEHLCEDISGLLLEDRIGCSVVVEGVTAEIPTTLAIPLGFIVNELITNAAKYARGKTIIRLKKLSVVSHSLSVSDDGPGFPAGFVPADSKGLGMKIVQSLVTQIGGEFLITAADDGHGACFTVTFFSRGPEANGQ